MVMSTRMSNAAASTPAPPAPVSHARLKPPGRRKRRQRGALATGRKKRAEQQAHERRHKDSQGNIKRIQTIVEKFLFPGRAALRRRRLHWAEPAFPAAGLPLSSAVRKPPPLPCQLPCVPAGTPLPKKAPAALSGAAVHRRSPSRPAEGNQRGNSIRSMAAGSSSMIREPSIQPRTTSKLRARDRISFWASVRLVSPSNRISRTARVISSQRSASCA